MISSNAQTNANPKPAEGSGAETKHQGGAGVRGFRGFRGNSVSTALTEGIWNGRWHRPLPARTLMRLIT